MLDFVIGLFENMVGYFLSMGFLFVKRLIFCVFVNWILEMDFSEFDMIIILIFKVFLWYGEDYYIVCEDESLLFLLFVSLNFGL